MKELLLKVLSSKYLAFTIASTSTGSVQASAKQFLLFYGNRLLRRIPPRNDMRDGFFGY
ncbi:MAG TPA: hypothetical protein VGA95_12220 [Thermodesulfobacteriota bacterium]